MESELKVLSIIGENAPNITQRVLSAKAELSLGAINVLLNKMIDKGLVKTERLNARTVRYMLTPNGMKEKARKTYDYVKRTYDNILVMKNELALIVQNLPDNSELYLYGEEDEVYGMLTMLLHEMVDNRGILLKKLEEPEEPGQDNTIIIWDSARADKLARHHCINILERLI